MSDTGKAIDRSSTHRRGIFRTDLLVVCDACGRDFERPASERTCGLVIHVRLTRETENENLGAVESFSLRIELFRQRPLSRLRCNINNIGDRSLHLAQQ